MKIKSYAAMQAGQALELYEYDAAGLLRFFYLHFVSNPLASPAAITSSAVKLNHFSVEHVELSRCHAATIW